MPEKSDAELLAELGVEPIRKPAGSRTPREARNIAGFEDIQKFVEEHGRPPQHGEDRDIFERLYAVRLDRLRELEECRTLLKDLDHQGLLEVPEPEEAEPVEQLDDEALLAALGVEADAGDDITELRHVRSQSEKAVAEEIGERTKCEDFATFEPLFDTVRDDLTLGRRKARRYAKMAGIKQGEFFIVNGQIAYVVEVGEEFITKYDRRDSRLRVIYDNGTESDILLRSFQRALHRDQTGRRITEPSAGPLFGTEADDEDLESGTIYVLRSKSNHPEIEANRELIHKIGVTGGKVETRIANAAMDATYLLAEVEIIRTYKLYNINWSKLENVLHRVFAAARLDLTIEDRLGRPIKPREWFLVPLSVIEEVVDKIRDQSITEYTYSPETASLVRTRSEHREDTASGAV